MLDGGIATVQTTRDRLKTANRALVIGLGATGLSVARWLAARGLSVAITDSRERPPQVEALRAHLPDVALFLGGFSQAALERADLVVLSPGVSRGEPIVQAALASGLPVVGDIELFAHAIKAPVIAVTGSNGKSTVATLVTKMVEHAGRRVLAGGNLGTPVLDLLVEPEPEFYVLELSSFQLESTESLDSLAGAILNVSADHLDRYPGIEAYAAAKTRIWRGSGVVVANRDDEVVAAAVPVNRETVWFGLNPPSRPDDFGLSADGWIVRGGTPVMPAADVLIHGRHNLSNAMAALALGTAAGLPMIPMVEVLKQFRGLPHRMELVAEHAHVRWYNDSKATNVGATLAAVAGMDGPLVLILGGDGKGQDFSALAPALQGKARAAVLMGRDRGHIAAAIEGVCDLLEVDDMHAAVRAAATVALSGDAVLLSPACSSLDMFQNYEARGRAYIDAVRGLQ